MLNVSSAFLTAIKQGSRTVDGSIGFGDKALTNLLPNGDFSNGSTGWSASGGTLTASNGIAVITGNGTSTYTDIYKNTGVPVAVGDKVYMYAKMQVLQACSSIALRAHDGTGSSLGVASVSNPTINTWYTMSGITAMDNAGSLIAYHRTNYVDAPTSSGKVANLQTTIMLNLTTLFGAGSEPTQAYMDALIAKVGFFNGTKNVPNTFLSTASLDNFFIDSALGNGNLPSIGATIASKLTLAVINDGTLPQTIVGVPIRPYVAVDVTGSGSYEWVKLGEFYADYDGIDIGKLETTIEAFDNMASYMDLAYNAMAGLTMTVQGVLNDLSTNYGVRFATQAGLPTSTMINSMPTGSVRQVLSSMASLMSTNATIDGDGCVKFIFLKTIPQATFELGLDNYSDFKLQPDKQISFTELIHTMDNVEMPWGDTSGYALAFQNEQVMDLQGVKDIYNRIFPITYYAYTMKAQGMPHIELGDVITFTYVKLDGSTATITIPILKHKFTFKGAFISEFSASAPQQQTTSVTVTSGSSLADAVDVTYNDLNESIDMATKQITGNKGGYITTILNDNNQPQELVISNTPDYNTADKVWRWNSGGLGFFNGFNGTANIALTTDGKINATMMTTGILDAGIIKAGKMQDASNQTWIDMTNGKFSFGGGKLAWDGSALTINYAGTQLETDIGKKADATRITPFETNISFANGIITLGKTGNPFSVNVTNQAVEFIDKGTTGGTLNLTAISGSGSAITCTYPAQSVIPYQVGGYIQISGCSVSAYNGTWLVTSCTTTQVVATSTATGTVSTGFGTIQYGSSPNTVAYINGQKMYITNLQTTQSMQVGQHQIYKYDANTTLIKFAG